MITVVLCIGTLVLTYFISSFGIYLSHRIFHKKWAGSVFRKHIYGHHRSYPENDMLSLKYRTPELAYSGKVASIVPFIVLLTLVLAIFPRPYNWVAGIGGLCMTVLNTHWFHIHLHLRHSPLRRFRWFRHRRRLHILHHRHFGKNFGMVDSVFDKLFGTDFDPSNQKKVDS